MVTSRLSGVLCCLTVHLLVTESQRQSVHGGPRRAILTTPAHTSRALKEETCRSLNVTKCARRQTWLAWEHRWDPNSPCVEWVEVPWEQHVTSTLSRGLHGLLFGAWVGCDWFYDNFTVIMEQTQELAPARTRNHLE